MYSALILAGQVPACDLFGVKSDIYPPYGWHFHHPELNVTLKQVG